MSIFAPAHPRRHQRPLLVADRLLRKDAQTQKTLLDHISLSLNPGQRIALTGPSGSGKSLLLRSLARLDPVEGGKLIWKAHPIADHDVPLFRSQVSYVAQQARFGSGTVESILKAPFQFRVHRSRHFDRERILRWIAEANRGEAFLRQQIEQLSGGERQLLAILRVIQLEPEVLLLDEPTAALDPQTTRIAEQWVLQWHAANGQRAFLWATHDPEQPQRVTDLVLTMRDGRWYEAPGAETEAVPDVPSSPRSQ